MTSKRAMTEADRNDPNHTEFMRRGFHQLAEFNAERARGIVHNPEWVQKMYDVQADYDNNWLVTTK